MYTVGDIGVVNLNRVGVFNVDAVSVGTKRRRYDSNGVDVNYMTSVQFEVNLWAVYYTQTFHNYIRAHEEPQSLTTTK